MTCEHVNPIGTAECPKCPMKLVTKDIDEIISRLRPFVLFLETKFNNKGFTEAGELLDNAAGSISESPSEPKAPDQARDLIQEALNSISVELGRADVIPF